MGVGEAELNHCMGCDGGPLEERAETGIRASLYDKQARQSEGFREELGSSVEIRARNPCL